MTTKNKNNQPGLSLWKTRKGILLQVIIVLIPSIIFLKSGKLLLVGLFFSVLLSWIGLKLQKQSWVDVGVKKSSNLKKFFLVAIVSTLVLIPLTYGLRYIVTSITNQQPNLEAFKAIEGNPTALLLGLIVVWIFGAFAEEMFFRGFLMNSLYKLFPDNFTDRVRWALSLAMTSMLVGIGHSYQGITGMILTGVIGFCFGLIYLNSRRNLWPAIFTHGLYDTVAFVMVFFGFNLDQLLK
jgi:membrane protease YdiL (CAAX protease family)